MIASVGSLVIFEFLSTLSLRRATYWATRARAAQLFLSTLSLRRATFSAGRESDTEENFYPRSPCGERLVNGGAPSSCFGNFYPRSPCGERRRNSQNINRGHTISIHALLAESDPQNWQKPHGRKKFLSTLSLRRATDFGASRPKNSQISIHALLAESDHGRGESGQQHSRFLSTLSLRRATRLGLLGWLRTLISIHALLAESDVLQF